MTSRRPCLPHKLVAGFRKISPAHAHRVTTQCFFALWPTEMSLTSSWRKAKVKLILISECRRRRQKGGNSARMGISRFSRRHFTFSLRLSPQGGLARDCGGGPDIQKVRESCARLSPAGAPRCNDLKWRDKVPQEKVGIVCDDKSSGLVCAIWYEN